MSGNNVFVNDALRCWFGYSTGWSLTRNRVEIYKLIRALRAKAAKRGIGYQTMLKIIVREHIHEY